MVSKSKEVPGFIRALNFACGIMINVAMIISSVCVALIIAVNSLDTFGRALVSKPFVGALEITELLLAMVIILAIPYAQRYLLHIEIDILQQFFSKRLKQIMFGFALTLTALVFLVLAIQSYSNALSALETFEVSAGYLPVPVWLGKVAATAGFFIAFFQSMTQLIELIVTGQYVKPEHLAEGV